MFFLSLAKARRLDIGSLSWLWLSGVVFVLDQMTKWLSIHLLANPSKKIIFPFLNFHLWFNQGAAFSFLNQAGGWQRWFFVAVGVAVGVSILVWLYRLPKTEKLMGFSLGLIFGGAIGNLYDRLLLGHVIDFIEFHLGQWYFPIFNVADAAISIGAAVVLVKLMLKPKG